MQPAKHGPRLTPPLPLIVERRYDRKLREYCKAKGVTYQSFWTLTGNRAVLASRAVQDAARRHGRTPEQARARANYD